MAGEDFAAGALAVLARPETDRRRAARQRAEEFGWPAAVGRFLAAPGLAVLTWWPRTDSEWEGPNDDICRAR